VLSPYALDGQTCTVGELALGKLDWANLHWVNGNPNPRTDLSKISHAHPHLSKDYQVAKTVVIIIQACFIANLLTSKF